MIKEEEKNETVILIVDNKTKKRNWLFGYLTIKHKKKKLQPNDKKFDLS